MESIQDIQNRIKALTKHISLRQIALKSGVNYITLRNIKGGKSKRITADVAERFRKFDASFKPASGSSATAVAVKPDAATPKGLKPGTKAARGKKAAKAPVKSSKQEKARERKPAVKKQTRRGRPPKKEIGAPVQPAPAPHGAGLLGARLADEIHSVEARLQYLRGLQRVEAEYLRLLKK